MSGYVSLLVCTFGLSAWRKQGRATLDALARDGFVPPLPYEAFALHHEDGTLASVRNAAAEAATGDWLLFVDADDSLDGGYLAAMRAADAASYEEPGTPTLLVPAIQYVDDRGQCIGRAAIPAWGRPLIDVNCACIGTLVPRGLFLEVGGFRETLVDGTPLTALEDWDLILRLVLAGASLVPVHAAVYCARAGHRRNSDQSLYHAIRAEHEAGYRERQREGLAP